MFDQFVSVDGMFIVFNVQIGDLLGGVFMVVVGILVVLVDVCVIGCGCYVDVFMMDLVFVYNLMVFFVVGMCGKVSFVGSDLFNGGVLCYGVYCMVDDCFMVVGVFELKFWQVMCDVIGKFEWKDWYWVFGQCVGGDEVWVVCDEFVVLFLIVM